MEEIGRDINVHGGFERCYPTPPAGEIPDWQNCSRIDGGGNGGDGGRRGETAENFVGFMGVENG